MGNYNRGSGNRGGSNFGNRGGGGGRGGYGGGRDRGRPEMHKAVCDDCGNRCEVPFKPSGDKPVLCSDCFKGGGRSGGRDFGGRSGGRDRGRREDRQMHKATCADCGAKCEVPFKPTGDKPVLCSECFGGGSPTQSKSDQSSEKHDEILAKLDKILTLLQRTTPVKEITVMKEKIEEVKEERKEEKTPAKKAVKKPAKKTSKKKAPAKKKTVKKTAKKKK